MEKCRECGFLASRNNTTGELVQADSDYRDIGKVTAYLLEGEVANLPLCFVQAWDLSTENQEQAGKQFIDEQAGLPADWPVYVRRIIGKERECPKKDAKEGTLGFTKYQIGFTPKEHREMMDRERMLQREAEREKDDRQFRKDERAENRKFRIIELVVVSLTFVAITLGVLAAVFFGRNDVNVTNVLPDNSPASQSETGSNGP